MAGQDATAEDLDQDVSDLDSEAIESPLSTEVASMDASDGQPLPPLGRRQLSALLMAAGSHTGALADSLLRIVGDDPACVVDD